MKKLNLKSQMGWLIPAAVTLCIVIYHLMYAVKTAQKYDNIFSKESTQIIELEARIDRLEEFCCGEVIKFQEDLKNTNQN